VLVHPLAGNPEPARDLQRIEPFRLTGRLWAEPVFLEDLEDACSHGVAESIGDLLERGWIELERLGFRHIGTVTHRGWTSQPRFRDEVGTFQARNVPSEN